MGAMLAPPPPPPALERSIVISSAAPAAAGLHRSVSGEESREKPSFRWTVSEDACRGAERGTRLQSKPFLLNGIPGEFLIRFWPKGHAKAKENHCSLFLFSTAGVEMQVAMHANECRRMLEADGPTRIKAGSDRGWFNFSRRIEEEATLGVVVLASGRDVAPIWPIPAHLKVGTLLGAGSYGEVREAWDEKEERKVAVKQLADVFGNTGDAKRILREMGILSKLEHPNVVRIYDIITPQAADGSVPDLSKVYICMEMCDTDLEKLCMMPRGLALPEVRRLAYTLCLGVSYVHSKGVYHRDLKPANCLANRDCTVKVCDFNLARVVDDSIALTRTLTQVVCSRWYRPPEVILELSYTTSVDVWSVGCILVELFRVLNEGGRVPTPKALFRASSSWPLSGGRNEGDMLNLVFNVFGTPFRDPLFSKLAFHIQQCLRRYPEREGTSLRAEVPSEATDQGLGLAQGMLQFFPAQRLAIDSALEHEFFKGPGARKAMDEKHIGEKGVLDLGFDEAQVSTSKEIREEMRRVVDQLHEARPVSLHLIAKVESGSASVSCVAPGGATLERFVGLDPNTNGQHLAQIIRETVPAEPKTEWRFVLPSGAILEDERLLIPLHELFDMHSDEVREPAASDAELCILCRGTGTVASLGTCPLCDGQGTFST